MVPFNVCCSSADEGYSPSLPGRTRTERGHHELGVLNLWCNCNLEHCLLHGQRQACVRWTSRLCSEGQLAAVYDRLVAG
jgi:hypothetical protein